MLDMKLNLNRLAQESTINPDIRSSHKTTRRLARKEHCRTDQFMRVSKTSHRGVIENRLRSGGRRTVRIKQ